MGLQSQRHIRDWVVETIAELKTVGRPFEICYCKETATWYEFLTSFAVSVDDKKVITTGVGGFSRWVARAGNYQVKPHKSVTAESAALAIALGF